MNRPETIAGRYQVLSRLGGGAAATVFRVRDDETNEELALKLLRGDRLESSPGLIHAFHREFLLLTDLRHPHLVRVHDFGRLDGDAGVPWFTMDLIEGRPVDEVLTGSPEWGALARCADAVLGALDALHREGLVHRDVSCANILAGETLDADPPPVWLMDLGLTRESAESEGGTVHGTVATIAPETLAGGEVDGRADLYSLGCVLFRLTTGRDPFVADDAWEILRAHLGTRPTPPRQLNPEIPASLEALILELLEKDPRQRPPTAEAVRRRLEGLSGRSLGEAAPLKHPLTPALHGREREIETFEELLRADTGPEAAAILVEGPAGSGRTRLLEEFRLRGRMAGLSSTMLRARSCPRRPFGLVDELLASAPAPGTGVEARLELLLAELAREPKLILIDDAAVADEASRLLLSRLALRARDAGLGLLLVLGTDPEGAGLAADLLERGLARLLRLRPFGAEECARVAGSMVGGGPIPLRWGEEIARNCGGLPALVVDLVGRLVHRGLLQPGPVPPEPPAELSELAASSPRSAHRVGLVWEHAGAGPRALLAAMAVAEGEPLRPDQIEQLHPRGVADPRDTDLLVEEGLVLRSGTPGGGVGLALAVPALAPAILDRLPPPDRITLHTRFAHLLASQPGAEARQARQLLAAGDTSAAWSLLAEAAHLAQAAGSTEEALLLADEVLAAQGGTPPILAAARARRIRAVALAGLGRPEAAEEAFVLAREAADASGDKTERAETLRASGVFRGSAGRTDDALADLDQALALMDELGDTAGGAEVLLETGRLLTALGRAETAADRLASGLRQAQRAAREDLEASLLIAQGELALGQGEAARATELFEQAGRLAGRSGAPGASRLARRGRVLALQSAGRLAEAQEELEGLRADSRQAANLEGEAEALELLAALEGRAGRRSEATSLLGQALELARRLARPAMTARLLASQSELLRTRGQLRQALEQAERAVGEALSARSRTSLERAAEALARARVEIGDVDGVEDALSRVTEGGAVSRALRGLLLGRARLAAGQAEAARALLQETCFIARRERDAATEGLGLLGLAEAYIELRESERASLALKKVREMLPDDDEERLAQCRVLAAEIELSQPGGDLALAREEAEAAAEAFARRERGDWLWRARAAVFNSQQRQGDVDAAQASRREAVTAIDALLIGLPAARRAAFRALPRIRPLLESAGGDQPPTPAAPGAVDDQRIKTLERLLEINHALNSTLELDRLLEILLDTAIELTGGERGFVLLSDGGREELELARGEGGAQLAAEQGSYSRSVARQVIRDDAPMLTHDALADERLREAESIHALQIRSILAHPLRVRGEVAGALVIDTRQPARLFTPAHQQLIARLAEQAGIALTNARLVAQLRSQADEIRQLNEKLREEVEEQRVELLEKQSNLEVRYRYDCMIGASAPMQRVYRSIDKILPTEIPVLITGESGTGKDLVARVLHYAGTRRQERFVTVNCAALTDTLLESELFGHRRGAFTGADRDRRGLFEQADGGTLFLDEIGELPLHLQPKLLRAIQFGEIRRVGEDSDRRVDVRLITATNRDMASMVSEGKFREDLFYRLDVARVHIAPLRERLEDIGLLVGHFLDAAASGAKIPAKKIEPGALRLFLRYDWPGNIRELENEVTKLAAFTAGEVITELDILENASFLERARQRSVRASDDAVSTLEAAEIDQIRQALKAAGGNRTRAAEMLGIDRSTLYRKLKKLGDELG